MSWRAKFYKSKSWKILRQKMINQKKGICDLCGELIIGSPEVHHMVELTEANAKIPEISLNPALLEVLHHECHDRRHGRFIGEKQGIIVDDELNIDYGRRKYAKPIS